MNERSAKLVLDAIRLMIEGMDHYAFEEIMEDIIVKLTLNLSA